MKKTVRFLFLFALLFTVAGAFAVSCQKGSEEDVPEVGAEKKMPDIQPRAYPVSERFTIQADGTTISGTSFGYSFYVLAKAVTFKDFTCYLDRNESFRIVNYCDLTLNRKSVFTMRNGGGFGCRPIKISGNGSIKLKGTDLNVSIYEELFSAAEGYTLTSSGEVDEGYNTYSCTWTVEKSK